MMTTTTTTMMMMSADSGPKKSDVARELDLNTGRAGADQTGADIGPTRSEAEGTADVDAVQTPVAVAKVAKTCLKEFKTEAA
eukprot:5053978-Karenia_brevis.AAC.1